MSRGQIRNLLINIPPRHSKTLITQVLWPAWVWLQDPSFGPLAGPQTSFFCASYAESLTIGAGNQCKRLMQSKWYWERWRNQFRIIKGEDTKRHFINDKGGHRFNTSVGGTGTGMGGDVLLVDDPHNVKEIESDAVRQRVIAWWTETLQSRFDDPSIGAFVVVGQRVKENDLSGYILENDRPNWHHICLPARYESDHPFPFANDPRKEDGELLWPAHMNEAALARATSQMTEFAKAGQYQQRPAPREGGMFKREWLEKRMKREEIPFGVTWWRHWDLAATERKALDKKGARSAGVLMGRAQDGRIIVADCIAQSIEGKKVADLVKATADADNATEFVSISIAQDPGQAGKVQKVNFIELLEGYEVRVTPEKGEKEARAEPFASQCEGGKVWLVEGPWNKEFLEEVTVFPGGKRKDIVDACSGAYTRLVMSRFAEAGDGNPVGPQVFRRPKIVPGYEDEFDGQDARW